MVSHSEAQISLKSQPDEVLSVRIHGQWFPDAFGGSMGELMAALSAGREPQTSGRDNLKSIRIAYAAVKSAQEGITASLDDWPV
ncbi:MAG: hypothetical protein KatS3mg115_1957 [Candidatus Poribacteria bacterium]|nr:MAG: hypothetical protein KatS3mg115_1957 [Candidatus Poribacteria bacterium]